MKAKKFITALILVLVLSASCAYAKVTEQQALSDPRIAPFVEKTKQQGEKFLPGRYAHVREFTHKSNTGEKINAPSEIVVEIGKFNSENNAYPSSFDVYGANIMPAYMTLDTSGAVPILKAYAADDEGNYEVIAEDFAVVIPEGNNYAWLLGSVETGEIRYLFPINDFWFPENWYEGTWKADDGTKITLKNDTVTSDGEVLGSFTVSDSRIAIKMPDGQRGVIFAMYNPTNKVIVMTFPNEPDINKEEVAEIFSKVEDDDKTQIKNPPIFKAPKKTDETKQPKFPKFPMPQPKVNLNGVWQAILNGQQLVLQIDGNQYYMWLNGQPVQMGTCEIKGNEISGVTHTGKPYKNTFSLDNSGKVLTMTESNNVTVIYQKVQ